MLKNHKKINKQKRLLKIKINSSWKIIENKLSYSIKTCYMSQMNP